MNKQRKGGRSKWKTSLLCGLQLEQQKTFGARFEAMQNLETYLEEMKIFGRRKLGKSLRKFF